MTKTKVFAICTAVAILASAPRNAAAEPIATASEPTFQSNLTSTKHISQSSVDAALSKQGLDQIAHSLLILAAVGFLALRKRS